MSKKSGKSEESDDDMIEEETSESEMSESDSDGEEDEVKVNITPKEAENLLLRLSKPFTPTLVNNYEPSGYFKPKVTPFKVIVPPTVNTKTAIGKLPTGTQGVEKSANGTQGTEKSTKK